MGNRKLLSMILDDEPSAKIVSYLVDVYELDPPDASHLRLQVSSYVRAIDHWIESEIGHLRYRKGTSR